jgi:hypothetical protein
MARRFAFVLALVAAALAGADAAAPKAQQQSLRMASSEDAAKGAVSSKTIDTLRKDAENQKAILSKKGKKAKGPTEAVATSMTPHLAMHSTRGVESGRGRREEKKQKAKYQKSVYGNLKLPPDEATPFFTTYVLHYAFPTIAVICTCLGCILLRTMKMYQKERWKGTSYFHGARRSAESLLPGLK